VDDVGSAKAVQSITRFIKARRLGKERRRQREKDDALLAAAAAASEAAAEATAAAEAVWLAKLRNATTQLQLSVRRRLLRRRSAELDRDCEMAERETMLLAVREAAGVELARSLRDSTGAVVPPWVARLSADHAPIDEPTSHRPTNVLRPHTLPASTPSAILFRTPREYGMQPVVQRHSTAAHGSANMRAEHTIYDERRYSSRRDAGSDTSDGDVAEGTIGASSLPSWASSRPNTPQRLPASAALSEQHPHAPRIDARLLNSKYTTAQPPDSSSLTPPLRVLLCKWAVPPCGPTLPELPHSVALKVLALRRTASRRASNPPVARMDLRFGTVRVVSAAPGTWMPRHHVRD
jgi:hypothetical protein